MDILSNIGVQSNYTPIITNDKTTERQSAQTSKSSNSMTTNSSPKTSSTSQALDPSAGVYESDDVKNKQNSTISDDTIIEAINEANKKLKGANTEFQFSVHEKTKQITVKIMNTETKEVVRELPPEKILDMVAKMWEMAGILIDEKR